MRNVTVFFDDGTQHVYGNVPDEITPDQVMQRASTDFSGRRIKHLDGGRGEGAPVLQQPKRDVGIGEALHRGAKESLADTQAALAMAAGGAGVLADKAVSLFTDNPYTGFQDSAFGLVDKARGVQQQFAINPQTERMSTGAEVGNMAGKIGSTILQTMFMPGKAVTSAAESAPIMSRMIEQGVEGAVKGQLPFSQAQAVRRSGELIDAGVDADTVQKVHGANVVANTGMMALPASAPGNLLKRAGTGAALNVGTGAAQRAGEAAILGDQYKKQHQAALDPKQMTMEGVLGAVMAGVFGPRAQAAAKTKPPQTELELVELIRSSPAEETGFSADALSQVNPNDPKSLQDFVTQLNERLFPGDTSNAANLHLIPKDKQQASPRLPKVGGAADPLATVEAGRDIAAPNWTVEGDGPNRVLGDGEFRDIAKTFGMTEAEIAALPREAQIALRDHADIYQGGRAMEAISARRKAQADADLTNRGEINPDYQGGGAAFSGGRFDQGARQVTLLDGELPVSILPGSGDGKTARIVYEDANGNILNDVVDVGRLTDHYIPVRQRDAQDFDARVSASVKDIPDGYGQDTLKDRKMPRQSTDRIAPKNKGVAEAPDKDLGSATVESQSRLPPPQNADSAPRGRTLDGESYTVDENAKRIGNPTLRLEDKGADPRLPSPDSPMPGRMTATPEGSRPTTYGENSPAGQGAWADFREQGGRATNSTAERVQPPVREFRGDDQLPKETQNAVQEQGQKAAQEVRTNPRGQEPTNGVVEPSRGEIGESAPKQQPARDVPSAIDGYIAQDAKTGRWKLSSPPPESMRDAVFRELDRRNSNDKRGDANKTAASKAEVDAMLSKEKPAENVQTTKTNDGKITIEVEMEDGSKAKMRVDPEQYVADIDSRMNALRSVLDCLRK